MVSVTSQGPAPRAGEAEAARVLVVDDEPNIRELVGTALRYEGFAVDSASSGREALAAIDAYPPDLVVLDVMLPDLDGFEVTRRLRTGGIPIPVVFLTAKDATDDKVVGLRLGGDDYVTKPFSLEELVERVRAVLRRAGHDTAGGRLVFADLELDERSHEVRRAGRPVSLTATEFRLLRYLMRNPRRVLSKRQIMLAVWDYDSGDGNVVETYVSYLRRKIDALGPPLLHTVRGVGYILKAPGT